MLYLLSFLFADSWDEKRSSFGACLFKIEQWFFFRLRLFRVPPVRHTLTSDGFASRRSFSLPFSASKKIVLRRSGTR